MQANFPTGASHLVVEAIAVPRPLATKGRWGNGVRRCVGLAVYCEIAMKVGEWQPKGLERELRRRSRSPTPTDGSLRALTLSGAPSWTTAANLEAMLPGSSVVYWANHPLFHLLECATNDELFGPAVTYAIDSIRGTVRDHFWPWAQTGMEPGSANPALEVFQDRAVIAAVLGDRAGVQALTPLDWLVLNLTLHLMARRVHDAPSTLQTAQNTYSAFTEAALRHPQLLVNWAGLAHTMAEQVWQPHGLRGRHSPVLTDPTSLIGAHVRRLHVPELLVLAEKNEAMALGAPAA